VTSERVVIGEVLQFDDASGLGAVCSDGGDRYPFHCVEIADGTRSIDDGAPVAFTVLAKLGECEAVAVTARA
jgi:CspA family cold shock protein